MILVNTFFFCSFSILRLPKLKLNTLKAIHSYILLIKLVNTCTIFPRLNEYFKWSHSQWWRLVCHYPVLLLHWGIWFGFGGSCSMAHLRRQTRELNKSHSGLTVQWLHVTITQKTQGKALSQDGRWTVGPSLAHSSKPVPHKQSYTNYVVRSYGAWTVFTCEAPQALQGSVFGFGIGTMLLAGLLYLG